MTHAVFFINIVPSNVLAYRTAYEKLFGSIPDLSSLKVFGSLCFMSTHAATKTKFDPKSQKCVFLGYKEGTKVYLMLDLNTLTIHLSQDSILHEMLFPYVTYSRTRSPKNFEHTTASPNPTSITCGGIPPGTTPSTNMCPNLPHP